MKDCQAWRPRGTGIGVMPSILRPGIEINPLGQRLGGCTSVSLGGGGGQDQEGVGAGGGGCLPEDGAPSLLCPDTVGVGLSQQQLTEVVVLHVPCGSSEVLHTVSRGPPGGRAGDLPGQDVETLLSADTSRPIGQSYLGGVCRGGSELSVHVVSGVGSADCWRILPRLARHGEAVSADGTGGVDHEPGEGLEVQPELADVVGDLLDGEGAGGGTAGLVAAGVGGVPDVGRVGGDRGAAAGGGDDAAHPEP